MLRAIKFAARLDFGFEPATWRALLRWRSEISKCAPPRLLEEIHRLLRGGAARRSFELLVETGVLAVLSPYLAGLLEGPGAPTTAPPIADDRARARRSRASNTTTRIRPSTTSRRSRRGGGLAARSTASPRPSRARRRAEDLDDEEREWHRVWADEPPARPAHAMADQAVVPAASTERREAPRAGVGSARRSSMPRSATAAIPPTRSRSASCSRRSSPSELRGGELHGAVNEALAPADPAAPRHAPRQRAPRATS